MDERHQKRIKIVQNLFAVSFDSSNKNLPNPEYNLDYIIAKMNDIDEVIKKYASRYPIEKIAKIDLAILRLAIFELLYDKKNPQKVVIDEAVVLAKELGNEKSYSFINGVLGSVLKEYEKIK